MKRTLLKPGDLRQIRLRNITTNAMTPDTAPVHWPRERLHEEHMQAILDRSKLVSHLEALNVLFDIIAAIPEDTKDADAIMAREIARSIRTNGS